MAIDKIRGVQILVKIGDGNSPEVFAHPAVINTKRGIKFNSSQQKDIVPDPANVDDPAWESVFIDGLNMAIDGSGKLDVTDIAKWDAWWRGGVDKNVQVVLMKGPKTAPVAVGYWQIAAKLPSWSCDGDRNKYADAALSIVSDGPGGVFTLGAPP